jgi:hypothetical protein
MENPRSLINRNVCRWTDLSVIPCHDSAEVVLHQRLQENRPRNLRNSSSGLFFMVRASIAEQAAP